ncbi:MAG: phytoene dehydrogenase-like protein [Urechidicola sp.]|jgi:phytoene dehydrogenase-like protein
MNRRHILKAGAVIGTTSVTGLSLWRLGQARSHDYDVAVVGAGVTGLAATEALKKKGLSVELLEASDRRGGRVVTDNATFGVPDDIGAHWFHGRNSNALYDYATIRLYDYTTMRLCDAGRQTAALTRRLITLSCMLAAARREVQSATHLSIS